MHNAEHYRHQTLLVLHLRHVIASIIQPRKRTYGIIGCHGFNGNRLEYQRQLWHQIKALSKAVSSIICYTYIAD